MSAGYPTTKGDFDSLFGGLATAIRLNLYKWNQAYLLVTNAPWSTDANMTALGYTQAEVTLLKAAATDLGGAGTSLYRIANGSASNAGLNNYLFNSNQLCGVVGLG